MKNLSVLLFNLFYVFSQKIKRVIHVYMFASTSSQNFAGFSVVSNSD